jgi:hypothetical protein
VNSVFSRKRFWQVLRSMHFNRPFFKEDGERDKDKEDAARKKDPLYKIRWFIDAMNQAFGDNFVPGAKIAIDEAMCGWKGAISFKQFNPMKPVKHGIKFFVVADCQTHYMIRFQIYTGKTKANPEWSNLGATASTVLELCRNYFGSHRQVFMDNFYSSIPLFDALADRGLWACGTVRKSRRGFPDVLRDWGKAEHDKGESKIKIMPGKHGFITAIAWEDTKTVYFLDMTSSPVRSTTCERAEKAKDDDGKPTVLRRQVSTG